MKVEFEGAVVIRMTLKGARLLRQVLESAHQHIYADDLDVVLKVKRDLADILDKGELPQEKP